MSTETNDARPSDTPLDDAPLSAREIFTLVMFAVMILGTAGCMIWLFFIR